MSPQYPPPVEGLVFVVSLSWAVISAVMLAYSIRMGASTTAGLWAVSFGGASVVAAVFFWKLVGA